MEFQPLSDEGSDIKLVHVEIWGHRSFSLEFLSFVMAVSAACAKSLQKVCEGLCWEGMWPCLDPWDVVGLRTTASIWIALGTNASPSASSGLIDSVSHTGILSVFRFYTYHLSFRAFHFRTLCLWQLLHPLTSQFPFHLFFNLLLLSSS